MSFLRRSELRDEQRAIKQAELDKIRMEKEDAREAKRLELDMKGLQMKAASAAAVHRRWWVAEYEKYSSQGKDDKFIFDLLGPRDPL